MGHVTILTREEIESFGPPMPEELEETGVSEVFLTELALKHVARHANPTTASVAESLCLPWSLTEVLLHRLYRERLIDILAQGLPAPRVMPCSTMDGSNCGSCERN